MHFTCLWKYLSFTEYHNFNILISTHYTSIYFHSLKNKVKNSHPTNDLKYLRMLLTSSHLLTFAFAFIDPTLINGSTLSHISANNNQHKYMLTAVFRMDYIAVALTGQFSDKCSQSSCTLVTWDRSVCRTVNLPTVIFFIKSCTGIIYHKIKHFDKLTSPRTVQSVSWPVQAINWFVGVVVANSAMWWMKINYTIHMKIRNIGKTTTIY